MKTYTLSFRKYIIIFVILLLGNLSFSQITIASYNFDSGTEGWIDGGFYAGRTTSGTYYCNNPGALFVRYDYNFNTSSAFSTPALDLSSYIQVDYTFCFTSLGLDANEGFDLEFFDGTSWVLVKQYRRGTDFANNLGNPGTNFTISLNSGTYNFAVNSAFRFIGQTSSTNEYNVFDDVLIQGISIPPIYTTYYETFDTNNGGWTNITATNDSWTWTNSYPVSITNELAEGGFWRNSNYNNYNSNTNIVIQSPQIDFTGLASLRFNIDVSYQTENNYDGMRILYSVGGGAYTLLGASGSGTNWYEDNTAALGSDGWNDNSHSGPPTFSGPYSHFKTATIDLSDATFSNQSNVRFRVQFRSDGSVNANGVSFDNVRIEANPITALNDASVAPADITSNLRLWLKANVGISATDGNPLTGWEDQAYDTTLDKEDASASTSLAPTYRDNNSRNLNFNPVLDFDNTTTEYMNGKGGYFSQDYFVVVKSDDVVDTQTGTFTPGRQFAIGGRSDDASFHEDPTGLAFGNSTGRYTDEVVAHNMGAYANSGAPGVDSYGRAYTSATDSFNHVLILNVKANAAGTAKEIYKNGKQIDNTTGQSGDGSDLNYYEFDNLSYLIGIGRSGISGRTTSQLNGRLSEIVSYSAPNTLTNKRKIQSYLAIKYGVTLQDDNSGLTDYRQNDVDYVDSNNNVIWDTSANSTYNYDVAGIGRDDNSLLLQKQSRSQNEEADGTGPTSGFLSMSLTDTYNTNNENISSNPTTFNDGEFLTWGNNNASLTGAATNVTVDMSTDIGDVTLITEVTFTAIPRIWKVTEIGGDVSSVEVSIPTSIVRTATPPNGRYLMFISATGVFDPTADYRVMTEVGGNLFADYDFDGTEYITFGWAPERTFERSVYFDTSNGDYIDIEDNLDLNTTGFTLSAWINRDSSSSNKSILSKRPTIYSEGYDFKITPTGRFQMSWYNSGGTLQTLTSATIIPQNEWHHLAIIYNGTRGTLYIDGVAETSANRSAPVDNTQSFFIGAAGKNTPTAFFDGNIDEVRVWDTNLSVDQLRFIMNQEIVANGALTQARGKYFEDRSITPTKNDIASIPWSSLAGYYPMSTYTYTNTKDDSGNGHQGALKNLKTVDWQTAPLPYLTTQDGDWDTKNTWLNGNVQTIPGTTSIVDANISIDWNIVRTSHIITINDDSDLPIDNEGNRNVLALFVDSNEIIVDGINADPSSSIVGTGLGLTVTHYLNLDGDIDLEGESQLIQSLNSDLEVDSSGSMEKDQQGTRDFYTYDYWASPVGATSTASNNTNYTLPDVLRNGTDPSTPNAITFLTSGYNGAVSGSNISIADYWIWKFNNQTDDDYASWQHVRSTGTLNAGEGYTMKGVFDTSGNVSQEQNYVYTGKPNNSVINLTLNAGNDYLVGNPYPSAIDAIQFIQDNGPELDYTDPGGTPETDPLLSGTLYFWDHWGGGSHNLADYQGGYATYNYSGAVAAASLGTNDPDVGTGGTPVYLPTRYIPPGKGFFVVGENTGQITFNNGQRVFHKDSDNVTRSSQTATAQADANDPRTKLRIGFNSINTIHRQLLVTVDANATIGKDWGFDAISNEDQMDDMYWLIDNEKYIIQGIDEILEETILPIAIKTNTDGINSIMIDELSNVSEDLKIYVHDKELDLYHDLRISNYDIFLTSGDYLDRFEITFNNLNQLNVNETKLNIFDVHFTNSIESIVIMNPKLSEIKSVNLFNILGQSVYTNTKIETENYIKLEVKDLSAGTYIIKIETSTNEILTKKVLIK